MTILRQLMALVDADPNARILIEPGVAGDRIWLRGEFADLVAAQAAHLREHGIGAGDCVGVWLPSWAEALAWQYAARAVGAHVVGINTRYNVAEVAHILEMGSPKAVVVAAGFRGLDLIGRLRDALAKSGRTAPFVVPTTGPGGAALADVAGFDVGAGAAPCEPPLEGAWRQIRDDSTAEQIAVAFTTSGSTGMPKLAAHRDAAVAAHATDVARHIGIDAVDVVAAPLPYSGTFGYSAIMGAIAAGATVLLHPVFDAGELLAGMAAHRATHIASGDDILERLRSAWASDRRDLSAMRWIGIGDFNGDSHRVAQWARDEFGTSTVGVYGSSEVFALTSTWSIDDELPLRWNGGGHLVNDTTEVRVVGDDGAVLPYGDEGEIQLRGPNIVDAYLGQPEKLAENVSGDGWFSTGDVGRMVGERTFEYVCRASDALRLSGFLVEPDEIAAHLITHPAVVKAKVVGGRRAGQTAAIGFVTVHEGSAVSADELIAHCARSLARFKVPAEVHVIDEMPVADGVNGTKIKAATLRMWAENGIPVSAGNEGPTTKEHQ